MNAINTATYSLLCTFHTTTGSRTQEIPNTHSPSGSTTTAVASPSHAPPIRIQHKQRRSRRLLVLQLRRQSRTGERRVGRRARRCVAAVPAATTTTGSRTRRAGNGDRYRRRRRHRRRAVVAVAAVPPLVVGRRRRRRRVRVLSVFAPRVVLGEQDGRYGGVLGVRLRLRLRLRVGMGMGMRIGVHDRRESCCCGWRRNFVRIGPHCGHLDVFRRVLQLFAIIVPAVPAVFGILFLVHARRRRPEFLHRRGGEALGVALRLQLRDAIFEVAHIID